MYRSTSESNPGTESTTRKEEDIRTGLEIAIIGMACRFPGAPDIHRFWENLKNGIESLSFLSDRELEDAGVPGGLLENPDFVKTRGGALEENEFFDAPVFGYPPGVEQFPL